MLIPLTPPPLPESWPFTVREAGCGRNVANDIELPGFTGSWRAVTTAGLPDLSGAARLDELFGRGGLVQAGDCILRPYRRGGLMRRFNKNTYLTPGRFKAEYDVHAALWDAGFPTVEPVGYAYRRHLWGFEGVFITKRADALPWPKTWGTPDAIDRAGQIAVIIKSLSAWGLYAPDLNATNFLVATDGKILALDWDRAGWTRRHGLVKSYWARLERSMYKLNAPTALIDSLWDAIIMFPNQN